MLQASVSHHAATTTTTTTCAWQASATMPYPRPWTELFVRHGANSTLCCQSDPCELAGLGQLHRRWKGEDHER